MKKLICLLIAIIVTPNLFAQEKVGENRDGKFVITENLKNLKDEWDKLAGENIINYSIVADEKNVETYYLLGKTEKGIKIAIVLELKGEVFYSVVDSTGKSSTCTCSGCFYFGCDPVFVSDNKWICDDPCNECVKSVTASNVKQSLSVH